jgi:hypothetical protein
LFYQKVKYFGGRFREGTGGRFREGTGERYIFIRGISLREVPLIKIYIRRHVPLNGF